MGGSGKKMNTSSNFYNINNIELLTETPSMIDVYGYELKGGHNSVARIANYKKLAHLLSDSESVQTTEMSQSAGQDPESATEPSATEPSATESSATESATESDAEPSATDSDAESPAESPAEPSATEPSATESAESSGASQDQDGGGKKSKKTKKQKRNFFEDSDLDSTTTDSDLSTLSTDDTSDNTDSDL